MDWEQKLKKMNEKKKIFEVRFTTKYLFSGLGCKNRNFKRRVPVLKFCKD